MKSIQKAALGLIALFLLLVWIVIVVLVVSNNELDIRSLLPATATPRPSPTLVACTDANKRIFAREAIALVYKQDSDLDTLNYADIDTFPEDDPLGGFVARANIRRIDLGSIPYPDCIIRAMPTTDSGSCRPLIPVHADH